MLHQIISQTLDITIPPSIVNSRGETTHLWKALRNFTKFVKTLEATNSPSILDIKFLRSLQGSCKCPFILIEKCSPSTMCEWIQSKDVTPATSNYAITRFSSPTSTYLYRQFCLFSPCNHIARQCELWFVDLAPYICTSTLSILAFKCPFGMGWGKISWNEIAFRVVAWA